MPTAKVQLPDGRIGRFDVPEGTTPEQVLEFARKNVGAPSPQSAAANLGWSDVPGQAVRNLPASAAQFGKDIVQPIVHPVDTAKALYSVGSGAVQKAVPGVQADEAAFDAVTKFFADRYGGMENLKRTLASDPVGFLADISTALTGGGALAARAPGMAGRAGAAVRAAGRSVDPLTLATKGVQATGSRVIEPVISNAIGSLGTHTGAESLRQAFRAGRAGGAQADAFVSNMRGTVPAQNVVDEARAAVETMRRDRGNAYRSGMAGVRADKTILDFQPIDDALRNISEVGVYKGKVINRSTQETWQKIADVVDEWRLSDPAQFHTPEGLDALKKTIGDIKDSIGMHGAQPGTPSAKIADAVYNAVRSQIVKQAPDYARVMKDYETASDLLREMEKTLSLNPKASVDTTLRKLQSILRNNANTNYGRRVELGQRLEKSGADTLMPALSGQMLQDLAPRGLGRVVSGANVVGGVYNPALLAALPFQSPRVMGEAAYAGGRLSRALANLPPAVTEAIPRMGMPTFQAGRAANVQARR